MLSYTRREPLGVVGAIIPWNAPVVLASVDAHRPLRRQHDGPEGGGGRSPRRARRGTGVRGGAAAGRAERAHRLRGGVRRCPRPPSGVRKLSFTGSTEVGKLIMHAAGGSHRARVPRARRQEPLHRLPRRRRAMGGGRRHRRHALHPPEPVVHGRLAPVPARRRSSTRSSTSSPAGSRKFKLGDPLDEATDIGALINDKQFKQGVRLHRGRHAAGAAPSCVLGGLPPARAAGAGLLHACRRSSPTSSNDWRHRARGDLRAGPVRHSAGPMRPRSSGWPTTATTVSPLTSGPTTSVARSRTAHAHRVRLRSGQPGARPVPGPVLRRIQAEWDRRNSRSRACSTASPGAKSITVNVDTRPPAHSRAPRGVSTRRLVGGGRIGVARPPASSEDWP